jgi:hypothetical protein
MTYRRRTTFNSKPLAVIDFDTLWHQYFNRIKVIIIAEWIFHSNPSENRAKSQFFNYATGSSARPSPKSNGPQGVAPARAIRRRSWRIPRPQKPGQPAQFVPATVVQIHPQPGSLPWVELASYASRVKKSRIRKLGSS